MSIVFSQEQEAFRAEVRKFMASTSSSERVRALLLTDTGFDAATWSRMVGELGLPSLVIDERYGGAGATLVELAIALEESGRVLHSSPLLSSGALATMAILVSEDEAALERMLPSLADGSRIATLALGAPSGAPSAGAAGTTATCIADAVVLTGIEPLVLDAAVADEYIVSATYEGEVGLFVVSRDAPGVAVTTLESLDVTRRYARLDFDRTPATPLGASVDRTALVERVTDVAAVLVAAEQIGGAQAVLDGAVEHAKTRVQFGQPIGMFQAIKHQCADMLAAVEMAKATVYHAVRALADAHAGGHRQGDAAELRLAVALAKALSSEVYLDVATRYIQILGGIGFTWEHDAHLHLRRAKSTEVLFGAPSRHRETIASLLGI